MRDSADVLGAQAVGLLLLARGDDLELLSATSHRIAQLELFQIQNDVGPCVDAIRSGSPVFCTSRDDIQARWPRIGEAIVDAGYQTANLTGEQITDRIQQALQARTLIEQAKGVLAYARNLDMAAAYDLLRRLAAESRGTITDTAAGIIAEAQNRNQN